MTYYIIVAEAQLLDKKFIYVYTVISSWVMEPQHYGTLAKWVKEIGLLVLASFVVQKIFLGAPLSDQLVSTGAVAAFFLYGAAIYLLIKS